MEAAKAVCSVVNNLGGQAQHICDQKFEPIKNEVRSKVNYMTQKMKLHDGPFKSLVAEPMLFSPMGIVSTMKPYYTSMMFRLGSDPRLPPSQRKKIVLLGTGWAGMTFMKNIDVTKYDVYVISPKTYFSFTPLLPSVCAGALSKNGCAESVRNHLLRGGKSVMNFYQASASEVNPTEKTIKCMDNKGQSFTLPYDYLVVGVGAEMNTFGIQGVAENTCFLKDAAQADFIHSKILQCFENAMLPNKTEEEKKRLLSFVIVGGGPSGVEVAAEFCDLIKNEVVNHYPSLKDYAKVTLIEMLPKVLPSFAPSVSQYTLESLKKEGCNVQLKSRVTKVTPTSVQFVDSTGVTQEVPSGFCLWASGVGQTAFAKHLMSLSDKQKNNRVLKMDETLKVQGLQNTYAFGDCAMFSPKSMKDDVDILFEKGKTKDVISSQWIVANKKKLAKQYPQINSFDMTKISTLPKQLTKKEFTSLLQQIDTTYVPPPPTAQSAAQEAAYLAKMFNTYISKSKPAPAWNYQWKGQMSYVGGGNSVIQTPYGIKLGGFMSHTLWKSAYLMRLMSFASQLTVVSDWVRVRVHGRNIGKAPLTKP